MEVYRWKDLVKAPRENLLVIRGHHRKWHRPMYMSNQQPNVSECFVIYDIII